MLHSSLLIPSLLTLLFSGFSLGFASVPTGSHQVLPFVGSFQVHRFSLENGLKILIVEDHSSPTFAYQTWFDVGSRNETPGKTGLAHLFEHMMFKGTKKYKDDQFDKLLEQAGVQGENAFTSRDFTVYVQELPTKKLRLIAELEADRMRNLIVDDHGFATEKGVVENERKFRNENNPEGILDQHLYELAFTKHPYRWPIVGYEDDLKKMTSAEARDFYQTHYAPNHATLIISGDVDAEKTYHLIKDVYGEIPKGSDRPPVLVSEPKRETPKSKKLKLNVQVEKLFFAFPVPAFTHDDIPALQVLQNILTAGRSSRLSRALVDGGIATSADAFDLESKDPGLFTFMISMQKGKTSEQAKAVLLREIERLKSHPVSAEELQRVRNKLAFEFFDSLASNSRKTGVLGSYETLTGDFQIGLKIRARMQTVTAKDIQRVAKMYLNPKLGVSVTGVPK
ncbi:MAG: insulinase family protein [Bdellovibrio sp.]|nr:insulinase family protein [Bdellovibrio sp.]